MIKLNILNMENFLKTVNTCKSEVHMLDSKGGKRISTAPALYRNA